MAGASLVWKIAKGDYSGGNAVELDLMQTRIEQIGAMTIMKEDYENTPEDIETDSEFPFSYMLNTGKSNKSFTIYGTFTDSGTDYAYDMKNKLISMYDSCRTGSLKLVQFDLASGTNTGSESFVGYVTKYNFKHQSPGVNRVDYQANFTIGSEMI